MKVIHPFWHCIVKGIEHWSETQNSQYTPIVTNYAPHLRAAILTAVASQNKIGWDNALRGFLSREWKALALLDMQQSMAFSAAKANARLRKVLTSLYDYSRATWEHHNKLLHTTESDAIAVSIRSATHAEIKHYHSRPHLLRFDGRHLCERSLTNFWTAVKQHNADGCGWLKNQRAYLKKRGTHRQ